MPEDKAQRNFTDPESRIMPVPGGRDFLQGYNCQAVVDSVHQVIVAARATNQPSDNAKLSLRAIGVFIIKHYPNVLPPISLLRRIARSTKQVLWTSAIRGLTN